MIEKLDRRQLLSHGLCLSLGAGLGWWVTRSSPLGSTAFAEFTEETPEERVAKLKLELPKPSSSRPTLASAVQAGDMLYVSGHLPPPNDGKPVVGKVGQNISLAQAQEAARGIGLVILGVVRAELGSLNRVVRLVKTLGMVNCTPEFTQQPQVINAFSELLIQVFGEKAGKGARSAVGMVSLPNGAPVEIECIFQVKT